MKFRIYDLIDRCSNLRSMHEILTVIVDLDPLIRFDVEGDDVTGTTGGGSYTRFGV